MNIEDKREESKREFCKKKVHFKVDKKSPSPTTTKKKKNFNVSLINYV